MESRKSFDENEEKLDTDSDEVRDGLPEKEIQHETAIISSYLQKRGEKNKKWKKKWFVLRPTQLCYYKTDEEYEIAGLIQATEIHTAEQIPDKKREFVFVVITRTRSFYLQASTKNEMDRWIDEVRNVTNQEEKENKSSSQRDISSLPNPKELTKSQSLDAIPAVPHLSNHRKSPGSSFSPLSKSWSPTDKLMSSSEDDISPKIQNAPSCGDDIVHIQGYLYKLKTTLNQKKWKRYWFVLRNNSLNYYKDQTEYEVKNMIPFEQFIDILDVDAPVKSKAHNHCFKVVSAQRSWYLSADSYEDRVRWMDVLTTMHGIWRASISIKL